MKSAIVILFVVILAVTAGEAWAEIAKPLPADYLYPDPKLSEAERRAVSIAEKWSARSLSVGPVDSGDGAILFLFGGQYISIVCAVFQICDVALEPGEQVNSVNLGDTARWSVEPALTGVGETATQHLIIKPFDAGLRTSVVVTTDRRTYHLRLVSHRTAYMPYVRFNYPDQMRKKWREQVRQQTSARQSRIIPKTGEDIQDLNFAYKLTGEADWKPLRVYDDGRKTFIQLPSTLNRHDAPVLLVIDDEGGVFREEKTSLVNYRIVGDRYEIDAVFDRAILVSGVGGNERRIEISRDRP